MTMDVNKSAAVAECANLAADMPLINAQSLRELSAADVFAYKVMACNSLPDRDHERFTAEALRQLAPMFVGRTMIADHCWSAKNQLARIYDAYVEDRDGHSVLMAKCYILRTEANKDIIAAIQGGILREVSVGCAVRKSVCSICGEEYGTCGHRKGDFYNGVQCICELHDPVDAYEMSFVAVPAQPGAGVTKTMKINGCVTGATDAAGVQLEIETERWRFE